MGCRGRPFFDLNEPPAEVEEETDGVLCFQHQKALPSLNSHASDLSSSEGAQRILNNHAFSHASSVSGFQPFVKQKKVDDLKSGNASTTYGEENKSTSPLAAGPAHAQVVEREEGEWSDAEGSADAFGINSDNDKLKQSTNVDGENAETLELAERTDLSATNKAFESIYRDSRLPEGTKDEITYITKDENCSHASSGLDLESSGQMSNNSRHLESNAKGDVIVDGQEESSLVVNKKEVKGIEASHALKCGSNPGKRHKLDQHKEAMLGKKRSRQTMFLNLEDVKQAGPIKTATPRRQTFSSPVTTRTVKENRNVAAPAERSGEKIAKDQKQGDATCNEGGTPMDIGDQKSESNGDINQGPLARPRRLNGGIEIPAEVYPVSIPRQSSWKQSDSRQLKNPLVSARKQVVPNQNSMDPKLGNKKHLSTKKQNANSTQYQDTSVERLLREVTNEKFWHHPEEMELQCVPGRFESVEEYVRVFEPLLFEECRAQLYGTWEELTETVSRDAHIMVRIKHVERRERGWYDVIVLPMHECKWTFKEGDVAVLSTPKPGTVRFKRNQSAASEGDVEIGVTGRVAGTVRRYIPIDTRDPPGAILHFYVGDTFDPNSNDDHILKKFHPKGIWYLTVLGSLATTQREYVALHAFRRLNLQMQTAILKPSPEHFPKYEDQPPAMPECFTPNFVEHLHRTFNGPQLAAIQWAAMHTAAGTSSGMSKRQDPWPFTLVQGPPGTGKTHTVWGMLNVIHLVQYQHYYTALLKKVAPESYKQANESNSESVCTGSIDEVLQSMDQNLFRTLPKLCPKPRMLVCAPSNAATDELLARVLDRGFIDGEMKVYRPDVARVGVDSQTRAAQAVSVERRTEQLLVKGREEILGWMQQLKIREAEYSRQIACLQRELNVAAAAGRAQGSVGVDPDVLVARDHNRDTLLQNLAAVVEGRDKILVELSRLLILETRFRAGSSFNLEEARANLEASFANEAEIVFTTVSSSGRKLFSRLTHGFDMVVIDEAAQASEVGVLPPLSLGAARCVLVGDPQQLPATVISKAAGTLLYSRSLFERFQQAGCPTMLLSVQYRMHPQIRDFPSRYFYQGRLTDSESVVKLPDEPYYKDHLLRPYVFYDITHGRESHRSGSVSYQNINEAQFCLWIYEHLQKTSKSLGVGKISVGIITPYKLQLKCLQREFEEVLNSEEGKDLYINTVDAFQGQERDVIIMSCVRASNHGVGFVSDIRRMNVALTRARRALWVMGNANALTQSDDWAALINDAKARNCYVDMESLPKDFLVPKGSPHTPLPGKALSNMRGLRTVGLRQRYLDMPSESRSGIPSEEEVKLNVSSLSRNGG
ncbi:helicase sen1-like [Telopea speciosissima]|uniref:helicase sen1-like n=1 Tax=Telopea speciosissima TaxID=54955 RepID=UPI001CC54DD2|nr:helicase sen1-like [Telopea speciosissima]